MVKQNLEKVIIPCFCYAAEKADAEKRSKMNKVPNKNKLFNNHFFTFFR